MPSYIIRDNPRTQLSTLSRLPSLSRPTYSRFCIMSPLYDTGYPVNDLLFASSQPVTTPVYSPPYDVRGRQQHFIETAQQRKERIEFLKKREWARRVAEWIRATSARQDVVSYYYCKLSRIMSLNAIFRCPLAVLVVLQHHHRCQTIAVLPARLLLRHPSLYHRVRKRKNPTSFIVHLRHLLCRLYPTTCLFPRSPPRTR
jgi:hypothetical protein